MDSKIEVITACREDIRKSREDENQIEFEGEGYHFTISKDPHRKSYCGCSEELVTGDFGAVRLYQCSECGARISVCVEGTRLEVGIGGVTSEDVARVSKAIIGAIWDGLMERDFAALAKTIRIGRLARFSHIGRGPLFNTTIAQIKEGWWDVAQICENGHVINATMKEQPGLKAKFCPRCSARTIVTCQVCGADTRGQFHASGIDLEFTRTAFCHSCGAAYPWTESLQELKALAHEARRLNPSEQEELAGCFDDLIKETSKTQAAMDTLKRCLPRVGKEIALEMRIILVKLATEAVKAQLGL